MKYIIWPAGGTDRLERENSGLFLHSFFFLRLLRK